MAWAPVGGQHVSQQTRTYSNAVGTHVARLSWSLHKTEHAVQQTCKSLAPSHWGSQPSCGLSSNAGVCVPHVEPLILYNTPEQQLAAVPEGVLWCTSNSRGPAGGSSSSSSSSSSNTTGVWSSTTSSSSSSGRRAAFAGSAGHVNSTPASANSSSVSSAATPNNPAVPTPTSTTQPLQAAAEGLGSSREAAVRDPQLSTPVQGLPAQPEAPGFRQAAADHAAGNGRVKRHSNRSNSSSSSSGTHSAAPSSSSSDIHTAGPSSSAAAVLMRHIKQSSSWQALAQLLQDVGAGHSVTQPQQPQQEPQQQQQQQRRQEAGGQLHQGYGRQPTSSAVCWNMRHSTALMTHAAQLHQRSGWASPHAEQQLQGQGHPLQPAAAAAAPGGHEAQQQQVPGSQEQRPDTTYRAFVAAAADRLLEDLPQCDARGLANAAWSLAVLQQVHSVSAAQLDAICTAAEPLLPQMDAQQLSNVAWAWQQLGVQASGTWWQQFLQCWQQQLPTAGPQAVAMCCGALVRLQVPVPAELRAAVAARADALATAAVGQQFIVNMLWALACWQQQPQLQLLQQCAAWLQQLQQQREQWGRDAVLHAAVATCIWSMARLSQSSSTSSSSSSSSVSGQAGANAVGSHSSASSSSSEHPGPPTQHVALYQQCGALCLAASQQQLHHFSSHSLSLLLWSAGTLQLQPSAAWQQEFLYTTGSRSSSLTGQQFSNMLWGMARLRWRPAAAWLQQQLQQQQGQLQAGRYSARDVSSVLLALSQLQYVPPATLLQVALQHLHPDQQPELAPQQQSLQQQPQQEQQPLSATPAAAAPMEVLLAVLCSCATLRCPLPQAWLTNCLTACMSSLTRSTHGLTADQVASLGWAVAVLRQPAPEGWQDAWSEAAAAAAPRMSPRCLALTLWAASLAQQQQQKHPLQQQQQQLGSRSSISLWAPAVAAAVAIARSGQLSCQSLVMLALSIGQLYHEAASQNVASSLGPTLPGSPASEAAATSRPGSSSSSSSSGMSGSDRSEPCIHVHESGSSSSSSADDRQSPPDVRPLFAAALQAILWQLQPRLAQCSSRQLAQLLLLLAQHPEATLPPGWCAEVAGLLQQQLSERWQQLASAAEPPGQASAGAAAVSAVTGPVGAGRAHMAWVRDVGDALWAAIHAPHRRGAAGSRSLPSSSRSSGSDSSSSSAQQLIRWVAQQQVVMQLAAGPVLLRLLWCLPRMAGPARNQLLRSFFAATSSPQALAARVSMGQLVRLSNALVRCGVVAPLPWRHAWRGCTLVLLSAGSPAQAAQLMWAAGRLRCCTVSRRRRRGRWVLTAAQAATAALQQHRWGSEQAIQGCAGLAACQAAQQLPAEVLEVLVHGLAEATQPHLQALAPQHLLLALRAMVRLDPARSGLLPRQQLPPGRRSTGLPLQWLKAWLQVTAGQLGRWPVALVVQALQLLAAAGARPADAWQQLAVAALMATVKQQQQQQRRRRGRPGRSALQGGSQLSVSQLGMVSRSLAALQSALLPQWQAAVDVTYQPVGSSSSSSSSSSVQRPRSRSLSVGNHWLASVAIRRHARARRRSQRAAQQEQQVWQLRQQSQQQRLQQLETGRGLLADMQAGEWSPTPRQLPSSSSSSSSSTSTSNSAGTSSNRQQLFGVNRSSSSLRSSRRSAIGSNSSSNGDARGGGSSSNAGVQGTDVPPAGPASATVEAAATVNGSVWQAAVAAN